MPLISSQSSPTAPSSNDNLSPHRDTSGVTDLSLTLPLSCLSFSSSNTLLNLKDAAASFPSLSKPRKARAPTSPSAAPSPTAPRWAPLVAPTSPSLSPDGFCWPALPAGDLGFTLPCSRCAPTLPRPPHSPAAGGATLAGSFSMRVGAC